MKRNTRSFDVFVIGGGIHGLSTAYWLAQKKNIRTALAEQFHCGNPFGSSHSYSRASRCAYDDPDLIKMMQEMHREEWPFLEQKTGKQLFYPNSGCFFGSGHSFKKYIQAAQNSTADIQILDFKEANRLFPFFRFDPQENVIYDKTAA